MKLSPRETAFLTLDLQKGILERVPSSDSVVAHATRAVEFARKHSFPVLHIGLGFSEGHPEIPNTESLFLRVKQSNLFVKGTASAEFHPAILKPGDLVIHKHRISAFSENQLDLVLRSRGIRHLVLFGVATSGIVLSTVTEAFDRDYRITILKDACFDADAEVHRVLLEKALANRAAVTTVDAFVSEQGG